MNNFEWYYWAGFIAADGSFLNKGKKKIMKLAVATKDRAHLIKMLRYFGKKNCWGVYDQPKYSYLICHCEQLIKEMQLEFDLKHKKTYNPPDTTILDNMTSDAFLAFFAGYIDGDGCIQYQSGRTDCQLSFRVHSSWISVLTSFRNRVCFLLEVDIPFPKPTSDGYCGWRICSRVHLRKLKMKISELNLPLLSRKWRRINTEALSKSEWQVEYSPRVVQLREKGYTFAKIGKKLGIKTTTAYNYFHGRNGGYNHAL